MRLRLRCVCGCRCMSSPGRPQHYMLHRIIHRLTDTRRLVCVCVCCTVWPYESVRLKVNTNGPRATCDLGDSAAQTREHSLGRCWYSLYRSRRGEKKKRSNAPFSSKRGKSMQRGFYVENRRKEAGGGCVWCLFLFVFGAYMYSHPSLCAMGSRQNSATLGQRTHVVHGEVT